VPPALGFGVRRAPRLAPNYYRRASFRIGFGLLPTGVSGRAGATRGAGGPVAGNICGVRAAVLLAEGHVPRRPGREGFRGAGSAQEPKREGISAAHVDGAGSPAHWLFFF
jgi:hypothetical protein